MYKKKNSYFFFLYLINLKMSSVDTSKIRGENVSFYRHVRTNLESVQDQIAKALNQIFKIRSADAQTMVSGFNDPQLVNYNINFMATAIYLVNLLNGSEMLDEITQYEEMNGELIDETMRKYKSDLLGKGKVTKEDSIKAKYVLYRYYKYANRFY